MRTTLETSAARTNRNAPEQSAAKPFGKQARPDPLQAARELRATIRATREESEGARRLSPQVVQRLIDAGLCRLTVPPDVGGLAVEPEIALRVIEELAGSDASVAWIVWINLLAGLATRYSSEPVRRELFGDASRIFAASTRPSGKAVVVEGGVRVSGRWSLVSGCELADWIPLMCVVIEGNGPRMLAEGEPETRMVYLPKNSFRILDTWHVGGLRATGSHDVVAEDVSFPRNGPFRLPTRLRILGRCRECRSSRRCAWVAARFVWESHRRRQTPCLNSRERKSKLIPDRDCGIGLRFRSWWRRPRRNWLPHVCCFTKPCVRSGRLV